MHLEAKGAPTRKSNNGIHALKVIFNPFRSLAHIRKIITKMIVIIIKNNSNHNDNNELHLFMAEYLRVAKAFILLHYLKTKISSQ